MNKTKKGLLTASSIITIVASGFAILFSIIMFFVTGEFDEKTMKQEYLNNKNFYYHEEVNGDYYFKSIEDGEEIIIYEDDIETISKFMQIFIVTTGVTILISSLVKILFAVRILLLNSREKFAYGSVLTLLVLSLIGGSLLESGLLIASMCIKDYERKDNKPLGLNDIEINNNTTNIEKK